MARKVERVRYTVTYYAENGDVLYESAQEGDYGRAATVQLMAKRLMDEAVSILSLWGMRDIRSDL